MWSVTTPHNHDYSDVGEHNYCRDPDGEGMLWCYTMDPGTEWEACEVAACVGTVAEGKLTI